MRIKKLEEIPEELMEFTEASLPDDSFADDVNRLFPLEDAEDVIAAFEVMKNIPYNHYDDAEKLYMLDRVCKAASVKEVNLEELIGELSPGGEVMIDTNSKEFKEAVASEVKAETERLMVDLADKDTRARAKKDYEDKIKELLENSETLAKQLDTVKAEKEKSEQDHEEFVKNAEAKAKIQERVDALKEAGLTLEDWTETEEAVADMSEKAFNLYKDQLKAAFNFDKKKKDDKKMTPEEKKKEDDKKKKAKASTDIVEESKKDGDLPNGETTASDDDEFPALTKWLEADYGTRVS